MDKRKTNVFPFIEDHEYDEAPENFNMDGPVPPWAVGGPEERHYWEEHAARLREAKLKPKRKR